MRKIEFRAWDKFIKKMILWDDCLNNETLIPEILLNNERYDIMQFTGLFDKNNKEIYEGDIVKDEYGRIMKVFWQDFGAFNSANIENFTYASLQSWFSPYEEFPEIIGNIYETPELIEANRSVGGERCVKRNSRKNLPAT